MEHSTSQIHHPSACRGRGLPGVPGRVICGNVFKKYNFAGTFLGDIVAHTTVQITDLSANGRMPRSCLFQGTRLRAWRSVLITSSEEGISQLHHYLAYIHDTALLHVPVAQATEMPPGTSSLNRMRKVPGLHCNSSFSASDLCMKPWIELERGEV